MLFTIFYYFNFETRLNSLNSFHIKRGGGVKYEKLLPFIFLIRLVYNFGNSVFKHYLVKKFN